MGKNVGGGLSSVFGGSRYEQGSNAALYGPIKGEQNYLDKLQEYAYAPVDTQGAGSAMLSQGLNQAQAAAQAQAASARGLSPALAQRLASMQQAQMAQSGVNNAAIMAAQERQQNIANRQNYLGMLGNQMSSIRTGQIQRAQDSQAAFEGAQQRRGGLMSSFMQSSGQAMGAAGGLMAASDERLKKDVSSGKSDANTFLDSLSPKSFHYKDPKMMGAAPGERTGVMAQDLEKTKPGSSLVVDTPQGKMVDTAQSMVMTLAALGALNDRVRQLEGMKMSHGGMVADKYSDGGQVPGKAMFGGDHPANDTVSAKLSPGEIVIPRSILDHQHAPDMAKSFVEGILASKKKDNMNSGGMAGYFDGGEAQSPWNIFPNETPGFNQFGQPIATEPQRHKGIQNVMGTYTNSEPQPAMPSYIQPRQSAQPNVPSSTANDLRDIASSQLPSQQTNNVMMPMQRPSLGSDPMSSGIRAEANALSAMGKEQTAAREQYAKDLADINSRQEQARRNYEIENDNLNKSIKNDKIDPRRYIANMSTGQKILTILGVFMGGFGGNGQNRALDMFNKAINDDIEAQKADISNKQNFYKMNMEKYKNDVDASLMTKANMLTAVQNQLELAAARAQSPIALAKAQQMLGQIQAQKQTLGNEFAINQAIQNGSPEQVKSYIDQLELSDPKRAADLRGRFVEGVGLAPEAKGAQSLREMQATMNDVKASVARLREITKKTGKSLSPDLRAEADTLRNTLVGALRVPIVGPGSLSEGDRELLLSIVPDVTGLTSLDSRTLKRLDTIEDKMSTAYSNMLKANSLKAPSGTGRQVERLDPKTGKTAIFDATTKQFLGYK